MINKVTVTGNISSITNKNSVFSILIACHEEYQQNSETKQKTNFMWVKTTQKVFEKHPFKVGDLIEARGKLSGGQYKDKDDRWQNNLHVFAFSLSPYREQEANEDEALPTPDDMGF
jgi:Single-strand binding protein family